MKKLWSFLTGKEPRSNHQGTKFKPGSRPAFILNLLCAGYQLGSWDVCKLLKTHNAARDLRHVRKCLRMAGVAVATVRKTVANGREYKVTRIEPRHRDAARKLIVGKA